MQTVRYTDWPLLSLLIHNNLTIRGMDLIRSPWITSCQPVLICPPLLNLSKANTVQDIFPIRHPSLLSFLSLTLSSAHDIVQLVVAHQFVYHCPVWLVVWQVRNVVTEPEKRPQFGLINVTLHRETTQIKRDTKMFFCIFPSILWILSCPHARQWSTETGTPEQPEDQTYFYEILMLTRDP